MANLTIVANIHANSDKVELVKPASTGDKP